ncbi:MAG: hypothetical protein IPH44_29680 [Myxococcales bacterium]|nr:hypothetical protein [Myxococcales bacterium]
MSELFAMTLDGRTDRLAALGFGALACLAFYLIHPSGAAERPGVAGAGGQRQHVPGAAPSA